jgi:hypothetical protein
MEKQGAEPGERGGPSLLALMVRLVLTLTLGKG